MAKESTCLPISWSIDSSPTGGPRGISGGAWGPGVYDGVSVEMLQNIGDWFKAPESHVDPPEPQPTSHRARRTQLR
jgi:hypothetical protein